MSENASPRGHAPRSAGAMGNLMMTFLVMVVGLALTPTIGASASTAAANLTGAAATLCMMIPLFWVVIIIAIGVAAVYVQLKGM